MSARPSWRSAWSREGGKTPWGDRHRDAPTLDASFENYLDRANTLPERWIISATAPRLAAFAAWRGRFVTCTLVGSAVDVTVVCA